MFLKRFFKVNDPAYVNLLSRAGAIGLHLASGIFVGAIMGYFLDAWLGTKPWCTGILLIAGIMAGFKNVYVDSKRLLEDQKRDEKRHEKNLPKN